MVFLVDNGSVRPASYLNLKRMAGELSQRIGQAVTAAPLLHADKISPDKLGGEKVEILENLLRKAYLRGDREWSLVPLFFGPSGAILDYLPRRLRLLAKTHPEFFCKLSHPLYRSDSNGGPELIQILGELTESVMEEHRLQRPALILVDHGSPRSGGDICPQCFSQRVGPGVGRKGQGHHCRVIGEKERSQVGLQRTALGAGSGPGVGQAGRCRDCSNVHQPGAACRSGRGYCPDLH